MPILKDNSAYITYIVNDTEIDVVYKDSGWLTNYSEIYTPMEEIKQRLAELYNIDVDDIVVGGEPKPSEKWPSDVLKRCGIYGLYKKKHD
jgi:hypothetical protein